MCVAVQDPATDHAKTRKTHSGPHGKLATTGVLCSVTVLYTKSSIDMHVLGGLFFKFQANVSCLIVQSSKIHPVPKVTFM